mgnify:CR=1 FL=1
MKIKPKNIAFLVLGLVPLIVLLQNTEVVSIQFLFWKISMSRIILIPILIVIGFIIGFIVGKKFDDF